MTSLPVEWVLVIHYGLTAHKATYGRLSRLGYTKDYIQLYRTDEFLESVAQALSVPAAETGTVPITLQWPNGSARGDFVFRSADRPHLKWETSQGAPPPWRMTRAPSDSTSETIPGNPDHTNAEDANNEFTQIASRGGGQPYLIAIKLKSEPRVFHLRTYLRDPSEEFSWASLELVPHELQLLARGTKHSSTLAWLRFESSGILASNTVKEVVSRLAESADHSTVLDHLDVATGRSLAAYLQDPGNGWFFNPEINHDAWTRADPLPLAEEAVDDILRALDARFSAIEISDAAAENLEASAADVEEFQRQISYGAYAVADTTATTKIRGSAQRAFANEVKANYGYRCAITGITTKDFLVASHIVPWSDDQSIRLDPSNGLCLSLLVDRAFENGYLTIDDDLKICIDENRVGEDKELLRQLQPLHGKFLSPPAAHSPRVEYLRRRRTLIASDE